MNRRQATLLTIRTDDTDVWAAWLGYFLQWDLGKATADFGRTVSEPCFSRFSGGVT
jgi:hypothetical protein